jgi:integrase
MPRIKFDQKTIDRMRAPDPSGKQKMFWDSSKAGFGVRVSGSKNSISYIVQRTLPNGLDRRITIGSTSEISLEEARNKADEEILAMRQGIDPKAGKKAGVPTLKQMVELYIGSHPNLAPKSIAGYRRALGYLTEWHDKELTEITPPMVEDKHKKLLDDVADRYSGEATANATMRSLKAWFNDAMEKHPEVTVNPVKLKKRQWFKVPRRVRHVSADQLSKFYTAVLNLENHVQRDYILLLLFTGLRREEAASLTWQDIDFTAKVIRIPSELTKPGRKLDLPMTDFILKMLKARRELGDAGFVFPANSKSGRIAEPKHPLGLVASATNISISAHDLRRTFSKAAVFAGVHTMELKALLNHAIADEVTEGYVPLNENDLRGPAQKITNVLKKWCGVR